MKISTFIFWLFCILNNVFAQSSTGGRVDTLKQTSWDEIKIKYDNPQYIIDDKLINDTLSKQVLNGLNPNDILEITILKQRPNTEVRSTIYITTKEFAMRKYHDKFSAFSVDYRKYIEMQMKYNHNDSGIQYIVLRNRNLVYFKGDEMIRTLYDIPAAKIINVEFHQQQTCCGVNTLVYISVEQ